MNLDPEILKKLIATFNDELTERLQEITDGLLKLENNKLTNDESEKVIEIIFRSAHNIKGSARSIGANNVGDIAHHIETLFSSIQKKSIKISPNIVNLCLEAIDNIHMSMKAFIDKKPIDFDIKDLLDRLEKGENKNTADQSEKAFKKSLKKEVFQETEQGTIRVPVENLDRLSSLIDEIQVNKIAIDEFYHDLTKISNKANILNKHWKQVNNLADKSTSENFKKLQISTTDSIVELTHNLRNLQHSMHNRINELSVLSNSLQEEIRFLRLVPAETLLHSLPRIIRDIAHSLNKNIELKMTGQLVKMDKIILEGLKDPLMHLLRNAIDHGIESADIRRQLGKPETGQIAIDIHEEGDHISITISDDGCGIDTKKIANTAIKKNLITEAELSTLSEKEILELIFESGFSTKELITDVSGRGIGLDIVKENLIHLKGQVTIKTELNHGTQFYIRVPLTLASERALLIQSGQQQYVIPTSLVERVLLIKPEDITHIQGMQAIMIEGHPVPLKILSDVLKITKSEFIKNQQLPVVILNNGTSSIGLLIEKIIGEREIIIKPLEEPLTHILSVVGGTLSGNGQPIIVLNPSDLIKMALQPGKISQFSLDNQEKKEAAARPHILVVDDSITTRTLEKNILESKNYQVTVAVNGKEAWDLLQKQSFALMITDINMPIMDGFVLTEKVKQDEKLREIPVIIVTSLDSNAEKKRGIEVGANAYIVKSEFESGTLLEIVEQLV